MQQSYLYSRILWVTMHLFDSSAAAVIPILDPADLVVFIDALLTVDWTLCLLVTTCPHSLETERIRSVWYDSRKLLCAGL